MQDQDLEHLADHLELIAATLELRGLALAGAGLSAPEEKLSRIGALQHQIDQREAAHPTLSAPTIARRLSLSSSECHVVWLLAAIAMQRDVRIAVARCAGDGSLDPSLDTIRAMIYGDLPSRAALQELGADGILRALGLIERSDGGGDVHESRQTWALSRRLLAALHGDNGLDPELASLAVSPRTDRPLDEIAIDPRTLAEVRAAVRSRDAVVLLSGMPGLGRRTLLASAAKEHGLAILDVDARRLAKEGGALCRQVRAIARECKLGSSAPLLSNLDALVDETSERLATVGALLVRLIEGPIFATCGVRRPTLDWSRSTLAIEMKHPTLEQRTRLWHAGLEPISIDDAVMLAKAHPLAPALIVRAAAAARTNAAQRDLSVEDIHSGMRSVLDDRVGRFATRVTVTQDWSDLVLAADQTNAIVELLARVRARDQVYDTWGFGAKVGKGLGVSALFSGPPGTGKTMVAALIARDLGLELYQVDLGKVISKYIGETEKQLAQLFDAAEAGHAILLFDEADALFGKRTDVKSSNDRYANLETNYLLQRLETFTGICLLTTNHDTHIDPAFQRRLSLHLRFELPDAAERTGLWRATIPSQAPIAHEVDFAGLAQRFEMSGGHIRNATMRAAFLAADEGVAISATHLEHAARVEYEGMGKITMHSSRATL